jgi:hypothetical protein
MAAAAQAQHAASTVVPQPTCHTHAQGCKCMIAIEGAKLELGKPDPDSAYWN